MKATDNQILMAAAQIAAGMFSSITNLGDTQDAIKEISEKAVNTATMIANLINVERKFETFSKAEMIAIFEKYVGDELVGKSKLESRIATGMQISNKKAANLIAQAEFEGIIGESKCAYNNANILYKLTI